MQQKIIALAVAALASGAVFAQSNVEIYGLADVGFSHRNDNVAAGVGSKNSIDSGIQSGSRIGFRGTEDLGNGLKALFTLEAGYGLDDGNSKQSGRLFGRQSFVGLTGSFGTAIAGRLNTPHYTFLSTIDPFGAGTMGRYTNVFAADLDVGGENLFDPVRVNNVVAYVSPSWSGFNVTAAYSSDALGQETLGNDGAGATAGDNKVFAVLPRYTNGPIDVGVSFHRIKNETKGTQTVLGAYEPKITNWVAGGSYDLKVVKLAAFYDKNKLSASNLPADITLKTWLVGATVPFGKHAFKVSYTQSKLDWYDDKGAGKAKQYALGYDYALSKRTNFYAAYAKLTNDNEKGTKANTVQRKAYVGDGSNSGAGYQSGFQVGLRHKF
ncbi:porin [Betaproteobacteria bacterium]|nr:porin [Betaproteobacteria bacterium]